MISTSRIAELTGLLGSTEDLELVNREMESLSHQLMTSGSKLTRGQLIRMLNALDRLSAGILAMDRVARDLMSGVGSRAVDCVG